MKRFLVATAMVILGVGNSFADISYTGSPISENFDSLGSTTISGVFSSTIGVHTLFPGTTGFHGTKIGGTGTSATALTADAGGGNSGGLYSYGAGGSPERAMGSLASGTNVMAFGFRLVNNSAFTLTDITVRFVQENWRSSTTTQNVILASWSTSAAPTTFLNTGTFTSVGALNLVGPTPVGSNGALDGNLPANQVNLAFTFLGVNLAPGASFYLRWQDFNDAGNDAGLAIDNMDISAVHAVPEPGFFGAIFGIAMIAAANGRKRRSN